MAQQLPRGYIYRPIHEQDAELLRRARDCIRKAKAMLELPVPSTFLGAREIPPSDKTERRFVT
jgi:hypothetical protein